MFFKKNVSQQVKETASVIWEGVKAFFQKAVDFVRKVINGILNFMKEVVEYFKNLNLNPKTQIPFVIDTKILGERIKNAPRVDVGIFKGVYDETTDEITHAMEVSADGLDDQTKEVLSHGEDGIVALS